MAALTAVVGLTVVMYDGGGGRRWWWTAVVVDGCGGGVGLRDFGKQGAKTSHNGSNVHIIPR